MIPTIWAARLALYPCSRWVLVTSIDTRLLSEVVGQLPSDLLSGPSCSRTVNKLGYTPEITSVSFKGTTRRALSQLLPAIRAILLEMDCLEMDCLEVDGLEMGCLEVGSRLANTTASPFRTAATTKAAR